jgi:hypothetical protein
MQALASITNVVLIAVLLPGVRHGRTVVERVLDPVAI